MSPTEHAYFWFRENVWPEIAVKRGLPPDSVPPDAEFTAWFSAEADAAYEMARDSHG